MSATHPDPLPRVLPHRTGPAPATASSAGVRTLDRDDWARIQHVMTMMGHNAAYRLTLAKINRIVDNRRDSSQ